MPVILDPDAHDLWLDPGMKDVERGVRSLEAPRYAANAVRGSKVVNDDETCSGARGIRRGSGSGSSCRVLWIVNIQKTPS
jgi:hypothetical protein